MKPISRRRPWRFSSAWVMASNDSERTSTLIDNGSRVHRNGGARKTSNGRVHSCQAMRDRGARNTRNRHYETRRNSVHELAVSNTEVLRLSSSWYHLQMIGQRLPRPCARCPSFGHMLTRAHEDILTHPKPLAHPQGEPNRAAPPARPVSHGRLCIPDAGLGCRLDLPPAPRLEFPA